LVEGVREVAATAVVRAAALVEEEMVAAMEAGTALDSSSAFEQLWVQEKPVPPLPTPAGLEMELVAVSAARAAAKDFGALGVRPCEAGC
jgi:hypothetical protein